MVNMAYRITESLARLDPLVREQLDWLEITTHPIAVQCHPHPLCGTPFGGPLAETDLEAQITELANSDLVGTIETAHTNGTHRIRLWSTPKERRVWEARVQLAQSSPAAANLLRQASTLKVANWRRTQAIEGLHQAVWAAEALMPTAPTNDLIALSQVARATYYKWAADLPTDYSPPALTDPTPEPQPTPHKYIPAQQETAPTTPPAPQQTPTPPSPAPVPAKTSARPVLSADPRFAGPAVVLDVDGVGMPDGSMVARPFSIEHWGDVARLADHFNLGCQVGKGYAELGQVWVMPAVTEQLGVDLDELPSLNRRDAMERFRDMTAKTAAVRDAVTAGWQVGTGDVAALGRWTRMTNGSTKVRIAQIAAMDPTGYPVLAGEPDAGTIAHRLAMFATSYGFPVKLSPQTTMFDYLGSLRWDERQRLFAPSRNWLELGNVEDEIKWSRLPTDEELALPYLHGYDRGGSYLSGIGGGAHFGIGTPDYVAGELAIGRNTVALCQIEADPDEQVNWAAPNPLFPNPHVRAGEQIWRTSGTIAYARELGYQPKILESWVWRETAPIYEPWYKRVVACRTQMLEGTTPDHDAVLAQLKSVYTRGIGQMGSDESQDQPHFHPERRWAILSRARNNLLRKVNKIGTSTGIWPVAWDNDTIVYASAEPDPLKAWPGDAADLGRGIGKLRWEGSTMLNDHLAWLNGDGWNGKQELTKDWTPTEGE